MEFSEFNLNSFNVCGSKATERGNRNACFSTSSENSDDCAHFSNFARNKESQFFFFFCRPKRNVVIFRRILRFKMVSTGLTVSRQTALNGLSHLS